MIENKDYSVLGLCFVLTIATSTVLITLTFKRCYVVITMYVAVTRGESKLMAFGPHYLTEETDARIKPSTKTA